MTFFLTYIKLCIVHISCLPFEVMPLDLSVPHKTPKVHKPLSQWSLNFYISHSQIIAVRF